MQALFTYFQDFFHQTNKPFLIFCTTFAASLIFVNFKWDIEPKWLATLPNRPVKFAGFYGLYLLAFGIPYLFYLLFVRPSDQNPFPIVLVIIAPAIFAIKVTAGGWQELIRSVVPGNNGRFLAIISDWPIRLLITASILLLIQFLYKTTLISGAEGYGLTTQNFKWLPYLLMVIAIVPLVAYAASQSAFLQTYPKLKALSFLEPGGPTTIQKILYELSYGSDFFTIELFFRGFLVVIFTRFAGPAAILPMAVFYCSIHFGKPLLECISSYFGGILLGIIACYSQSIIGGIIVHLGLAWMMELAAILASNRFIKG
jgi:Type II CAAX prenyl endopeptidase Rce1-like